MGFFSTAVNPARAALLFVLVSAALICGMWVYGRVSDPVGANLDKLEYGMTMEKVKSILGEPSSTAAFGHEAEWTYPRYLGGPGITLTFHDGKLSETSEKGLELASAEGDAR
jgi:hypothetical protein